MATINKIIIFIQYIPIISKLLNRIATNKVCNAIKPRPRAFSTWSHIAQPKISEIPLPYYQQGPVNDYTSWPMLTNMEYSSRHLPPAPDSYIKALPNDIAYDQNTNTIGDVTELFLRPSTGMTPSRSSCLFMFFAQWFTDSVLRVNSIDRRKNTSNHNIDLCQIYGLTEETSSILRDKSGGQGKLKSQHIKGEEFPAYLGHRNSNGEWEVKHEFKQLPYASPDKLASIFGRVTEEHKDKLYATGLERGNSSVGYVAISTLFLREHNRICDDLISEHPSWDDERLFQTSRMINIILLMKFVVEEYINHIANTTIFRLDHTFAEKQNWYRKPWITIEFDILYRFHGLVPDELRIANKVYDDSEFRFNNGLLEETGLDKLLSEVSSQAAGKIGLKNVPKFMIGAEYAMIRMGRDMNLKSFNDYREKFNLRRIKSFEELTSNEEISARLKHLYGDINNLEYTVGLFAEEEKNTNLFGDLINRMVAYDAFTQIYTNPLLSVNVYNEETLSSYGIELIKKTKSINDFVSRNTKSLRKVSFSVD